MYGVPNYRSSGLLVSFTRSGNHFWHCSITLTEFAAAQYGEAWTVRRDFLHLRLARNPYSESRSVNLARHTRNFADCRTMESHLFVLSRLPDAMGAICAGYGSTGCRLTTMV